MPIIFSKISFGKGDIGMTFEHIKKDGGRICPSTS